MASPFETAVILRHPLDYIDEDVVRALSGGIAGILGQQFDTLKSRVLIREVSSPQNLQLIDLLTRDIDATGSRLRLARYEELQEQVKWAEPIFNWLMEVMNVSSVAELRACKRVTHQLELRGASRINASVDYESAIRNIRRDLNVKFKGTKSFLGKARYLADLFFSPYLDSSGIEFDAVMEAFAAPFLTADVNTLVRKTTKALDPDLKVWSDSKKGGDRYVFLPEVETWVNTMSEKDAMGPVRAVAAIFSAFMKKCDCPVPADKSDAAETKRKDIKTGMAPLYAAASFYLSLPEARFLKPPSADILEDRRKVVIARVQTALAELNEHTQKQQHVFPYNHVQEGLHTAQVQPKLFELVQ